MTRLLLYIYLLSALLTGCGGGNVPPATAPTPDPPFLGWNNRAVLSGSPLGYGTMLTSHFVKSLPFSHPFSPALVVSAAYASDFGGGVNYFIRIHNYGPARCFIQLLNVRFYNSANVLLLSKNAYITGSRDMYTNTCLATNEYGYALGIALGVAWSDVAYITVDDFSLGLPPTSTSFSWSPITYSIISPNSFFVTALNNGPVASSLSSTSMHILFDSNNRPLDWGFLSSSPSTPAGNTALVSDDFFLLYGTAAKMEVFLN